MKSLIRQTLCQNSMIYNSNCSSPVSCGYLISSDPSFSKLTAVALQSEQCSKSASMIRALTTQLFFSRRPSPAQGATTLRMKSSCTQWLAPSSISEWFWSETKVSPAYRQCNPSQSPSRRSSPNYPSRTLDHSPLIIQLQDRIPERTGQRNRRCPLSPAFRRREQRGEIHCYRPSPSKGALPWFKSPSNKPLRKLIQRISHLRHNQRVLQIW